LQEQGRKRFVFVHLKRALSNTGCYGGVALDLDDLTLRVGKRTHVKRDALAIIIIYTDTPTVFLPGNDRRGQNSWWSAHHRLAAQNANRRRA
jgi:hypothetical protein